jgi:hypothetical protein
MAYILERHWKRGAQPPRGATGTLRLQGTVILTCHSIVPTVGFVPPPMVNGPSHE